MPDEDPPASPPLNDSPKTHKIVLIGDSALAEIAFEYFTWDSPYEVVGFVVEREFLTRSELFGLPVVAFDELTSRFPPSSHHAFVAISYNQLNRVRRRLYESCKASGYTLATYVSSKAFVWRNVKIGENCFIFENNVIQPFVSVGDNVVMWSGNHIGHHSRIGDHCFIASHAVVSGYVEMGESCFVGVNATFANNLRIGSDCLIGADATILKDTPPGTVYGSKMTEPKEYDSLTYFKVPRE